MKQTTLLLLLVLTGSVQASEQCEGVGLLAKAGALYREKGLTEQEAIATVDAHAHMQDSAVLSMTKAVVLLGYHGGLAPDQAAANMESQCNQFEAQSARQKVN